MTRGVKKARGEHGPSTAPEPTRSQIIDLQGQLATVETEIPAAEADRNALVYRLYALDEQEIKIVEAGEGALSALEEGMGSF